jgi:hypothetical protein
VDNTAACPGLGTQTNPWCDFSVVNSTIFGPGDHILLKSGDTFTSGMFLEGSGTSANYVTVGSYGAGPSPIINGNGNTSIIGVQLYNESYVEVEDLNIENAEIAILINDPNSQTGYRFLNLHLSGNAVGIQSPSGSDTGIASNVLVQDVEGVANTLACVNTNCEGSVLNLGGTNDVIVNRLFTFSNCSATEWGLGPGASNVVVENSASYYDANCDPKGVGSGTAANFLDHDTNVTFVNDIVADVPPTGPVDLTGIDIEPADGPDNGVNIEDNYIANNAGPGIEINDYPNPNLITGINISGNVLSDNGARYSRTFFYPLWGQIWTNMWIANSIEATGSIKNNLYYAPAGTGGFEEMKNGCGYYVCTGATFSQITQSNNLDVSSSNNADNVWYAANGFSCATQGANGWSYQSSVDNSTWTNLSGCTSVSTLDQEWTTGSTASGFVSNFEELPPSASTSWTSRSWTAPSAGSVSIRGRILMTDPTCGSAVTAEITQNGSSAPIWGPQVINAGDGVGVDTNLDGVNVNAGDVLHFAVQEHGSSQCRVSWTPSVANPNPVQGPVTTVTSPSTGAALVGSQSLQASASDSLSNTSYVQFALTGGSMNQAVVATQTFGPPWSAEWNTATVPDGTYMLQSVLHDGAGNVAYSPPVTVTVANPATTSVVSPSQGSWVSGSAVKLDAATSDSWGPGVTKVEFHLSGGSLNNALIATAASPTSSSWLAYWDSTTVPDGTYTLQSDAYDANGNQGFSSAVTIIVKNTPPTTSVLYPSNGATVSGNAQILAAGATPGVTSVTYELTGGPLSDQVVATATPTYVGWIGHWNTTGVPNGDYTLQSVASYANGMSAPSAPLTITVAN